MSVSEALDLKIKYHDVLVGFEQFSFTEEQLAETGTLSGLEMAQSDLEVCRACDGESCRTGISYSCINPYWHKELKQEKCGPECYKDSFRGYYALNKAACKQYGRPVFAVNKCPGVEVRKEEILESLQPKEKRWYNGN